MTIAEASLGLYEWFSTRDSFSLESDFKRLVTTGEGDSSEEVAEKKAAVICALQEYEELFLIKSCEISRKKIWVLKKNFTLFDQTLKISADTGLSLSQVINGVNKATNVEMEGCDPKRIEEKDIKHLIMICSTLIQMSVQKSKE